MSDKKFLSVFTPSRTPPEDLETIFVQRHALLKDAVERVQESAETGHKHHLLFAGPRGSGKTHLVTLLVHRLSGEKNLDDRLHIAWLNEDETSTTLLELLLKVYGALVKRYPESYQAESLEPAFDLAADAALEFVKKVLLKALGKHTLLIVMENLDALFDGLGDRGQKQLRAFIQEHPVFCIVGTAQTLVNDLTDRSRPFYGFFQTEHMKPLSREEAAELLMNIARHNDQTDVVAFLETARGRARVRALHHLSGGNHRIYIVLSQFITRDNIDSLVAPFQKMVDELTPYYQERIRWLPPQQRKIVEHLCKSEGTVPVKELARQLFASHQTISNQLKDLREKGYIKASQRGRESLYEVTEPLMRICVEVKENQNYEPLRLLVDFVRVWYDDRELDQRLQRYDAKSLARQYLQAAVERNASDGNLRQQLLIDGIREKLSPTLPMGQLEQMCTDLQGSPEELALAVQSLSEGNTEEALELIAPVIDSKNALHRIVALNLRASVFASQGEVQKAI
ncbi:MAG: MarR family transcriptional regulator, partial [Verrucomicrobiae bacterium]|nr:MarR family transcriptional regulator [Verrucomicrobiae bacterium]